MKIKLCYLLVVVVISLITGCSQLKPVNNYAIGKINPEETYISRKSEDTLKNAFEFKSYNDAHNKVMKLEADYACIKHKTKPDKCDVQTPKKEFLEKLKFYRDTIAFDLISYSNEVCGLHHARILMKSNVWNIGVGGASLLFSQLGAITDKVAAATNWSAAASFFTASKELVNSEILMDSLAANLITISRNLRKQQLLVIKKNLKEPYLSYKFNQAVSDINEYHNSCSFYVAITELNKLIENQKPTKSEIETKIKNLVDLMNYQKEQENKQSVEQIIKSNTSVSKEIQKLLSQLVEADIE